MTEARAPDVRIVVRVHDRPAALERVVGLLRRRACALRKLSIATVGEGLLELVIRIDTAAADPARVRSELLGLHDVATVSSEPIAPSVTTKELLLARVRSNGDAEGSLLEMIGTPEEIDATITRLRAAGSMLSYSRSGEIAIPELPPICGGKT